MDDQVFEYHSENWVEGLNSSLLFRSHFFKNLLGFNLTNSSEDTILDEYDVPRFTEMSLIKSVVLVVMFVIAFVGNTATLVRMYRIRRRRSTINLLITHLAVADLFVSFFCNVTDAVWTATVQWYAGDVMCKTIKFLQVFGLYLSTYVIVIISIDRCLAILDPISRNKAPARVRTMLTFAWVLSFMFSLPQSYIFRLKRAPFDEVFYQCVTYGAYSSQWQEQVYSSLSVLLMFIIPLVTMVTAYMLIFCTISRKSRDFQASESRESLETLSRGPLRSKLFCRAKTKSLRMTALIVLAFIVCWTPYQIMFIAHTFAVDSSQIDNRYVVWIFFFGMANSMVNPLIYGAFVVCRKEHISRVIEPRVQTPSSSQSSSSKVLRYYLQTTFRGCGVPLQNTRNCGTGAAAAAAAGAAAVKTNYPMAIMIRNQQPEEIDRNFA